ncbi:MAG: thrombospondin type 3 repeat-containing protein [Deltaproteobacteria bacterium]|nr:thrombospondin type 3 repeat-containing protein [Deltaproteobacteria bacterium]
MKNKHISGRVVWFFGQAKQGRIENSKLAAVNATDGIVKLDNVHNIVTRCSYHFTGTFDVTRAIVTSSPGDLLIAPHTFSTQINPGLATWTFSGAVDTNANRVELYRVDPVEKSIVFRQGGATADGTFALTIDVVKNPPTETYVALGMNNTPGAYQTSLFSTPFENPSTDPQFFSAVPSCSGSTWLLDETSGGLDGDMDGDGLSNGMEDVNADCTVDEGETDPANPDTDDDGVGDTLDNCPTTSNADQLDTDSNGVGDACTLQEPEEEGGDGTAEEGAGSENPNEDDGATTGESDESGGADNADGNSNDDGDDGASTGATGGGCQLVPPV